MSNPLFVKDASVKFTLVGPPPGTATEFNCDVHSVMVEATPGDDVTYETLCPDGTYTRKGSTTYVLHLVGVQDWATGGLSRFLWDNAGVISDFKVQAHGATTAFSTSAPGIGGQVTLVEGSYGGEADTWAEYDVSLPCVARPALVTTGAVGLAAEASAAKAAA